MSLFGKKPEPPASAQTYAPNDDSAASNRPYGVIDLIRLMKTIPIDHHPDLVVRVIKTTLESVGVQSSAVIEDALRQESAIRDRIATLEGDIDGLKREIQDRRDQIAQLQVDLSETIYAKERLQSTETVILAAAAGDASAHGSKPRTLPPPLPPPHKTPSGKPPEPITGT
jgi:hypothetical protein